MSVAPNRKGGCASAFWRVFPHVSLFFSLVLYALLGAKLFQLLEQKPYNESHRIDTVAQEIVEAVQNHTGISTQHELLNKVGELLKMFKNEKDEYQNWRFSRSLFFCCTVFTTVGYGHMYPVTQAGKLACILYAMIGIPLMLLVISDVGDVLAVLLSKVYTRLSLFFRQCSMSCSRKHVKGSPSDQMQNSTTDGTYIFSQDIMVDTQQVIRIKSSSRHASIKIQNNQETFDQIIAKENIKCRSGLTRSLSCPDLDAATSQSDSSRLFTGIGEEMDHFNVPILIILLVIFTYMVICSQILKQWETQMGHFDALYFTFITLTTIGFGDILPEHPKFFMVTFLVIIMGMAIMGMAFKLSQSQIVSFYQRCIKCLTMGRAGLHRAKH